MAKGGKFGKSGGGAEGMSGKLVKTPMPKTMAPKGAKMSGSKKGY